MWNHILFCPFARGVKLRVTTESREYQTTPPEKSENPGENKNSGNVFVATAGEQFGERVVRIIQSSTYGTVRNRFLQKISRQRKNNIFRDFFPRFLDFRNCPRKALILCGERAALIIYEIWLSQEIFFVRARVCDKRARALFKLRAQNIFWNLRVNKLTLTCVVFHHVLIVAVGSMAQINSGGMPPRKQVSKLGSTGLHFCSIEEKK